MRVKYQASLWYFHTHLFLVNFSQLRPLHFPASLSLPHPYNPRTPLSTSCVLFSSLLLKPPFPLLCHKLLSSPLDLTHTCIHVDPHINC